MEQWHQLLIYKYSTLGTNKLELEVLIYHLEGSRSNSLSRVLLIIYLFEIKHKSNCPGFVLKVQCLHFCIRSTSQDWKFITFVTQNHFRVKLIM